MYCSTYSIFFHVFVEFVRGQAKLLEQLEDLHYALVLFLHILDYQARIEIMILLVMTIELKYSILLSHLVVGVNFRVDYFGCDLVELPETKHATLAPILVIALIIIALLFRG